MMMRKGQVERLNGRDAAGQAKLVASLFGVAAWRMSSSCPPSAFVNFRNATPTTVECSFDDGTASFLSPSPEGTLRPALFEFVNPP